MNLGVGCVNCVNGEWLDRPVESSGLFLTSAYVQPPGVYSCNPPGAGWPTKFVDCTNQSSYLWCNANTSNLSGQRRIISHPANHPSFDFDTFVKGVCGWHAFGNADASKNIQQLWGAAWTSVCSQRIPNFQCEPTSKWAQVLFGLVGISSRILRFVFDPLSGGIGDDGHVALEVCWQGAWKVFDFSFNRGSTVSAAVMFESFPRGPWIQYAPSLVSPYNPDPSQNADIYSYQQAFVSGNPQKVIDWTEKWAAVGIELNGFVYFKVVTAAEQLAYANFPWKQANWVPIYNLAQWLTTCYS